MLKRIVTPKRILYASIFIVSLIIMSRIGLLLYNTDGSFSDDYINSSFNSFKSIIEFIHGSYLGLTGAGSRLLIYFLTSSVMMYDIWLWRVLNSVFLTLLLFAIIQFSSIKLDTDRKYIISMIFLIISLSLINISTLYWSIFWVTGSFNYLWSPVAVLICLFPLYQLFTDENKLLLDSKSSYLYIFPLLLAVSSEQGSAVIFVFSILAVIYHFYKNKRLIPSSIIFLLISLISIAVHLLSPGNSRRVVVEVQGWYANFAEMSIFDKLLEGFNWTVLHHFFYKNHYLLFLLVILLILISIKSDKIRSSVKFIPYFILSYIGLYIVLSTIDINLPDKLYIYSNALIEQVLKTDAIVLMPKEFNILPTIIQSIILLLIPYLIYQIYGLSKSTPLILIYFASLASSLLLSFSPTVYASGARVFFLSDILILVILVNLFVTFINLVELKEKLFRIFVVIVILLVISNASVILSKYMSKLLRYII